MSNRQRGGKTLSAEDEITADSVNLVGTGLYYNGNKGTATFKHLQYLLYQ